MSKNLENPEWVREQVTKWDRRVPNLSHLSTPPDYPERQHVAAVFRHWNQQLPNYNPPYYVAPAVIKAEGLWADPENPDKVLRDDFGTMRFDKHGRPLNPKGRAGIAGRGGIGRWGESRTADGIITRTHGDETELLIIRKSSGAKPALPGGFIDVDEELEVAAIREVQEETKVVLTSGQMAVRGLFTTSQRTTDHAWIVTNGYYAHLEGSFADQQPVAGDDATEASWEPITPELLKPMSRHHAFMARLAVDNS